VLNVLTVDLEDFYQVSAFESTVLFENWPTYESRVEHTTHRLLSLFHEYRAQATFFVLGWEAEQRPKLVAEIARQGHEVACHGYRHRLIYSMTPSECRDDILRSKRMLEDITGTPVRGFRAPSYSIVARSLWCLDILIALGFEYDSSIFPIHHDRYGIPGAERFPHQVQRANGTIIELPLSTIRMCGQNVPVAGGAYLRFLPVGFIVAGVRRINTIERQPAIVYMHPWEIDPDQPRLKGSLRSRVRHYTNLRRMESKLRRLLSEFPFGTASRLLAAWGAEGVRRLTEQQAPGNPVAAAHAGDAHG
jgi:polysaccharide deacetylase family protein (PEP-CTERM system associated)